MEKPLGPTSTLVETEGEDSGEAEEPPEELRYFDIEGYVNLPVSPYDGCYREYFLFRQLFGWREYFLPAAIAGALMSAVTLAVSVIAAAGMGKRGKLTALGRVPFDLAAAGLFLLAGWGERTAISVMYREDLLVLMQINIDPPLIHILFTLWAVAVGLCLMTNQTAAGVLREKLLLRRAVRRLSPGALALLVLAVHFLLVVFGIVSGVFEASAEAYILGLLGFDLALVPCLICWSAEERRIRRASNALAAGDLGYKVNTRRLHLVWKELGRDLNSIGDGMALAVEERMRSERVKTELITNVSHDLKTPLTSIINYIELLKDPALPEETRREYLEVLDRQGAKLKKLTADVVEASKAASGAVTVRAEIFDVRELLEQSVGEYSERLSAVGIEPVLHLPEQEAPILADPRLLGRVLDNLITNILKYAQPATRAYFDLEAGQEKTVIALKNTSREPLDIPADELMERFVRGDSSRSSEGSGLGLAIARSITELMDGQLRLILDGDLFKAEVTFPTAAPQDPPNSLPEDSKSQA